MIKRLTLIASVILTCYHLSAQTYIHEDDVMNQFVVMETGAGALKPDLYYKAFHPNYRKDAHVRNKLGYRMTNQYYTNREIKSAENIDSSHVKRAEVEALNVVSRTSSVSDVAWLMEKDKIEGMFNLFNRNINKIVSSGGTSDDYKNWKEIYDCLQCAVKLIRNSYLDSGSRKKEYLAIYRDIVRRNYSLTQQLLCWNRIRELKRLQNSAVTPSPLVSKENLIIQAKRRWHTAMAVDGFSPSK